MKFLRKEWIWNTHFHNVEDGLYKLKVEIDSESNNTEDSDLSNNVDSIDLCVGDCSQPDLNSERT